MTGRIPENILDDVLSRVDIVEVISGYMPLKRAGRNFKANCPFHHEKTPSFMVSPDRQIYHCFGCGESGNAFKFLMRYERLEFPEAVRVLAKKAGVLLPETQYQDDKTVSVSTQLYKINELAVSFYEKNLSSSEGAGAKNYLLNRGIKEETIKTFKIGFAPERWDGLISYLRSKNIGLSLLEKAGLILPRESGGYYDRFRSRIVFPIFDIKARPIGFGGRVLSKEKSDLAKYVNSPETPVYIKGRNLYGLNFTKDAIRQSEFAVIVEGYLDFILPYQEGLNNIVASLGTALTIEQVRLLKRYAQKVVMVYDPDDAGQLATLRTLDIFLEEDIEVRIVSLPEGFDPDLFVRENGIDSLKDKIDNADGLFDYQLKMLRSRHNVMKEEGKRKVFDGMLPTIKKIKNAILRSEYIKKLAELMDVPEFEVRDEFNKIKDNRLPSDLDVIVQRKKIDINPAEKLLIKLMLEEAGVVDYIKERLEPADFQDERVSRIVSIMFDLFSQGKNIEPSILLNHLDEDDASRLLCESMFLPEDLSSQNKERVIFDCVERLKSDRLKLKKHQLHQKIQAAQDSGDNESLGSLMQEFHNLIKKG